MADLAHHAQDLRRGLMLHRIVEFFDAQRLDCLLLTLGPVDGTAHLCNCDLSHNDSELTVEDFLD